MDGRNSSQVNQADGIASTAPTWQLLAILLALSAMLHVWVLTHTEVAARDSIAYIRYAWRLEHLPWTQVLREGDHHPGYPAAVLLMKQAVEPFHHGSTAMMMQLSAQLVSCVFGVLLVVPMFLLGRELFSPRVGFWSALLLQVMPATGHVLSDGLSEAMFLCLVSFSTWMGVRGLRTGSKLNFSLSGAVGALAYLTRPEGALIVGATGLLLVISQVVRAWQRPWRRAMACMGALAVPAIVVGCPLLLVTGKLILKPTPNAVIENMLKARGNDSEAEMRGPSTPLFATFMTTTGADVGFQAVTKELVRGFNYVGWIPALLALWWERERLREQPGHWILLIVMCSVGFLLWRVATLMGYVSDRHTALIIFCGVFWITAGLAGLPSRLALLFDRLHFFWASRWCRKSLAPAVALLAFALPGLPRTMERLHYNRGGFREAGDWLASHSTSQDPILDPYCWSHYYAGRVFIEGLDTSTAAPESGNACVKYVVLEESNNPHPNLPEVREAERLVKQGTEVYRWKGRRGKEYAEVAIYKVPLEAQ
jgi:hypothetical protein